MCVALTVTVSVAEPDPSEESIYSQSRRNTQNVYTSREPSAGGLTEYTTTATYAEPEYSVVRPSARPTVPLKPEYSAARPKPKTPVYPEHQYPTVPRPASRPKPKPTAAPYTEPEYPLVRPSTTPRPKIKTLVAPSYSQSEYHSANPKPKTPSGPSYTDTEYPVARPVSTPRPKPKKPATPAYSEPEEYPAVRPKVKTSSQSRPSEPTYSHNETPVSSLKLYLR